MAATQARCKFAKPPLGLAPRTRRQSRRRNSLGSGLATATHSPGNRLEQYRCLERSSADQTAIACLQAQCGSEVMSYRARFDRRFFISCHIVRTCLMKLECFLEKQLFWLFYLETIRFLGCGVFDEHNSWDLPLMKTTAGTRSDL